jgi:protein tyrosine phosphatase (PTP) superfamily phosphohydrolase (DUF442 family)
MGILNYLVLNKQLITGGHLSRDSFKKLSKKGVTVVINLLPSNQNFIDNEEFLVAENNMDYIYIPVEWDNPKATDFNSFVMAMKKHQGKKIFVHCAKNMRVSAFVYLYRILYDNIPKEKAKESMEKIWKPSGTWKEFIEKILKLSVIHSRNPSIWKS